MMQLLLAMPAVDDHGVEEFLARVPAGSGQVSCLFVWYVYEQETQNALGFEEFEQACRTLGRTTTLYGRQYLTGVDQDQAREWLRDYFDQ